MFNFIFVPSNIKGLINERIIVSFSHVWMYFLPIIVAFLVFILSMAILVLYLIPCLSFGSRCLFVTNKREYAFKKISSEVWIWDCFHVV